PRVHAAGVPRALRGSPAPPRPGTAHASTAGTNASLGDRTSTAPGLFGRRASRALPRRPDTPDSNFLNGTGPRSASGPQPRREVASIYDSRQGDQKGQGADRAGERLADEDPAVEDLLDGLDGVGGHDGGPPVCGASDGTLEPKRPEGNPAC